MDAAGASETRGPIPDLPARLQAARTTAQAYAEASLAASPAAPARSDGPLRGPRLGRARRLKGSSAGELIYAVGDVHGRFDLLLDLAARIARDASGRRHLLVFSGDYIDRGPASAEVLEWLVALKARLGGQVRLLKGNHEQALLRFIDDPSWGAIWLERFGGAATLAAYGVVARGRTASGDRLAEARDALLSAMPASHLRLLLGLELMVVREDYAFVHAGVTPDAPLSAQTEGDLLWAREEFLSARGPFEKIIVHGHTWDGDQPALLDHRIGLDTGAYQTGVLSAVRIQDSQRRVIQALDAAAAARRTKAPAAPPSLLVSHPADYAGAPAELVRSLSAVPSVTLGGRFR